MDTQAIIQQLRDGQIGVLATDTIYGLVACALDAKAVERVYEVRRRRPDKPCIILIGSHADIGHFGITLTDQQRAVLDAVWPGPVSVVMPCSEERFSYLHRGTQTLAFRLPADESLRELLQATGPLIAPSANPEGQAPAHAIEKARAYFDDQVAFYQDVGPRGGEPSTVAALQGDRLVVLRQGAGTIPAELL